MLLPTTLPTAMSRSPRIAARTEVATSGSDVPAATMVRPITSSLRPSTAPAHRPRRPASAPRAPAGQPAPTISDSAIAPARRSGNPFGAELLAYSAWIARSRADSAQMRKHRVAHMPPTAAPRRAADRPVERQEQRPSDRRDHQRHVQPHQLLRHHQRRDQRRQPEDEQHVEDVAADHVAEGDVALAARADFTLPRSPARWCRTPPR